MKYAFEYEEVSGDFEFEVSDSYFEYGLQVTSFSFEETT
jgi:hypothetical protein